VGRSGDGILVHAGRRGEEARDTKSRPADAERAVTITPARREPQAGSDGRTARTVASSATSTSQSIAVLPGEAERHAERVA
jgi:hypothetical protein